MSRFDDASPSAPKMDPRDWDRSHGRSRALPDEFTTKDSKIRWTAWEHDALLRLARRECTTLQGLVRSIVRKRLLEEFPR